MNWRELDIRVYAVAASLVLSLYVIATQQLPNDDAYTYIRTAELFVEQGLGAAFENYTWPAYSIGIGIVGMVTNLDLFTSALLLNALFFALLTWSFVSLLQCVSSDKRIAVLGALTILLFPQINEYRHMIIRDPGFWAFGVFSIWQFVRLYHNPNTDKDWQLTSLVVAGSLIASLFRGEALLYLLALPFALLHNPSFEKELRKKRFINCLGLIIAILISLYLIMRLLGFHVLVYAINFIAVYLPFFQDLFSSNAENQHLIAAVLFNEHAANYSVEYVPVIVFLGMLVMLIATIIKGIGAPFSFLFFLRLLHTYKERKTKVVAHDYLEDMKTSLPVVSAVAVANLLLLITFLLITKFLSLRYTMMLSLTMALFVPFVVNSYLPRVTVGATTPPQNSFKSHLLTILGKPLIALFFSYCLIDAYYSFGESKTYISAAVEWVQANSTENTILLTNNNAVAFGSGLVEAYDKIGLSVTLDQIQNAVPGSLLVAEHSTVMNQAIEAAEPSGILEKLASFPESEPRVSAYVRTAAP